MTQTIKTLFLDVGGVLGSNGWDHGMRKKVFGEFGLPVEEMEERHHLIAYLYETGKMTFDEYLDWVVFYCERPFSRDAFKIRVFSLSSPDLQMITLFKKVKELNNLKVVLVSNEGRELALYRIDTFGLTHLADFFIFSSFIQLTKPDRQIYKYALDLSHSQPSEVLYIDDRKLLIETASLMGIRGIEHVHYSRTVETLKGYHLKI